MIRTLWFAALLAAVSPVAAQTTTAEQLSRAQALYDELELERAARLLRAVISPQWSEPVQPAQRVAALKLLGATLVLVGQADSAVTHFRNALQLDPFTDLEPDEYTPAQVGAFARARRRVFAVATRPVTEARIDPRLERIRVAFATTHAAAVQAELRSGDSIVKVFESATEGTSEIVWDGLTSRGRLAPSGRYEMRVRATSRVITATDSASAYFDLRTDTAPLEDTLPELAPGDLLPERKPASAGVAELGKGVVIAGGVILIAGPLTSATLGSDDGAKAAIVASAGVLAGIVAFIGARKQRDIPANVTLNRTRLDERRVANQAITERNAARVAQTVFIITPAAGKEP